MQKCKSNIQSIIIVGRRATDTSKTHTVTYVRMFISVFCFHFQYIGLLIYTIFIELLSRATKRVLHTDRAYKSHALEDGWAREDETINTILFGAAMCKYGFDDSLAIGISSYFESLKSLPLKIQTSKH